MSTSIRLWLQDPMTRIFPDTSAPGGRAGGFELSACRGEVECFQIGIRTEGISPNYLKAEAIELKGRQGATIPTENVDILYPEFVPVKWATQGQSPDDIERTPPAFFPDPLMPGWEMDVAGPAPPPARSIWVRIRVPRDARPGTYHGKVAVRIGRRDFKAENQAKGIVFEQTRTVSFRLRVWSFEISERTGLLTTNWLFPDQYAQWYGLEMWSPKYWKLMERVADNMAAHRQNVILTPFFGGDQAEEQLVGVQRRGQRYTFDFRRLDRWIRIFLKRHFELIEGQHVASASRQPVSFWEAGPGGRAKRAQLEDAADPRFESFLTQFFRALWGYLDDRKWKNRFIQHISDEPNPTQYDRFRRLAGVVREAAPGIRLLDALAHSEFADLTDHPVPLESQYDRVVNESRVPAEKIWVYYCCGPGGKWPNRFIEYHLIRVRIIAWICFQKGIPGFLHWGYNWWKGIRKGCHNPWDDATTHRHPGGDGYMVYPPRDDRMSRDEVIDSIRWEIFREALEDYEYLAMTRERAEDGHPEAKAILRDVEKKVVPDWTTYTRDWKSMYAIRERMGNLLSGK